MNRPHRSNRPEKIKTFFYGTEYYRYPTPFEEEWPSDFARMKELGFNIIKTESAWASMEPRRGEYTFDEMDRLVDTCEEHGMAFIPNLQWEAAPGWVYRDYDVHRVSPWGMKLPRVTYANAYAGWLMPCFDSPTTRELCGRFMEVFVERYRNRTCIPAWDVWVEPRSRPGEECACRHSTAAYHAWLGREFGSVEEFNRRFHKRIGCWEDLQPPPVSPDFAEMYLWRQWACQSVADRVRWAADIHRRADPSRPVMAHVGFCSLLQDPVNDSGDDFLTSREVDFYGASLPSPVLSKLDGEEYRRQVLHVPMINDWIRSHSKYYWIMEVYPGIYGSYLSDPAKKAEDVRFDLWTCLAHGASGLEFWQYRPELFGYESRTFGLADNDGSPNESTAEAGRLGRNLLEHGDMFHEAQPAPAKVAIFYDKRSDLIRYLEGSEDPQVGRPDGHQNRDNLYKRAQFGCYRMLYEQNVAVEYVTPHTIDRLPDYAACILPMAVVMDDRLAAAFRGYVEAGGLLIAEVCTGMRGDNTICNTGVPGSGLNELFACAEGEVAAGRPGRQRRYVLGRHGLESGLLTTSLSPTGAAEVLAWWEDDRTPAVVSHCAGKGKAIYFGTEFSLAAARGDERVGQVISRFLKERGVLPTVEVSPAPQITARLLRRGADRVIVLTNHTRDVVTAAVSRPIPRNIKCLTGEKCCFDGDRMHVTIRPRGLAVIAGEA